MKNTMKNKANSAAKRALPIFLICLFPFMFCMRIAFYQPHYEGLITGQILGFVGVAACLAGIVRAVVREETGVVVLYLLAAVSCVFFCYWIGRIPFCAECEPMFRSDLGFMLEPFADRFGDVWLD